MHKFEFPLTKGNSGNSEEDFETNNFYLNRMAADSVNLSQSLSPH